MQFSHSKRTVIMKRLLLPILAALLLLPPAPAPAAEGAAPRHVAYDQGAGRTSALPVVKTGSYVYLPTGTYTFDATDLEVAGRGVPLALERTYRSNLVPRGPDDQYDFKEPADGPFGFGWHSPWFVRLWQGNVKNSNGSEAFFYYFLDGDGRIYDFSIGADGSIAPNTAAGLTLTRLPFGFALSRHRGASYSFDDDGRLTRVRDPQGRETALSYDAQKRLVSIVDPAGRTAFSFAYSGDGNHIAAATDLAGRRIDYSYDAYGNLVQVKQGEQVLASYRYNSYHGIVSKTNAVGETYRIEYQYPEDGIAGRVTDPAGTAAINAGQSASGHSRSFRYDFDKATVYSTDNRGRPAASASTPTARLPRPPPSRRGRRRSRQRSIISPAESSARPTPPG